jgi:hypothetical protein
MRAIAWRSFAGALALVSVLAMPALGEQRVQPPEAATIGEHKAKPTAASPKGAARKPAPLPLRADQGRNRPQIGSSNRARATPAPARREFGRVQLETGSFGFETQTRLKAHEFPDGRPLSAIGASQEKPSYFGFSLSVPTR